MFRLLCKSTVLIGVLLFCLFSFGNPVTATPSQDLSSTVIFIDKNIDDYSKLAEGALDGTKVFLLDSSSDGVEQIARALEACARDQRISDVHIVSHGSPGCMQLGKIRLHNRNIDRYRDSFLRWSRCLSADANLYLYGCSVVSGEKGRAFIRELSYLTGTDISSSDDPTGNLTGKGNWNLEYQTKKNNLKIPFTHESLLAFKGLLDVTINFDSAPRYEMPTTFTYQNFTFNYFSCYSGWGNATNRLVTTNQWGYTHSIISNIGPVVAVGMDLWMYMQNGNCKDEIYVIGYLSNAEVGRTIVRKSEYTAYKRLTLNWKVDKITFAAKEDSGGNNGVLTDIDNFTYKTTPTPVISQGDSVTVNMSEDGSPTAFALSLNAGDSENGTITWSIQSNPSHGTATVSGTGSSKSIAYTPAANYYGTDSFVVKAANAYAFDSITVNMNIGAQPDNPVAVNDSITINEEQSIDIDVLPNDRDPDNETITLASVTSASHGQTQINGTKIKYTPNSNYTGSDLFDYTIKDPTNRTSTARVTVTVNPINDAPTDLQVSSGSIGENLPVGTLVGTLSSTDVDSGDTHTYTFPTPSSTFRIEGNRLLTNALLDFEAINSYTITVKTTDSGSGTFQKDLLITVLDNNDAPSAVSLSNSVIEENKTINSLIGTLSTVDQDTSNTHTYSLAAGEGSGDNNQFVILDNRLLNNNIFNYEAKNVYSVRIQTNDGNGGTYQSPFTITVSDANDRPSDLFLSNSLLAENLPVGTLIGDFITTDPDATDSHTYVMISGSGDTDNAAFVIEGNQLKSNAVFNFEVQDYYSIRVQVTDTGGLRLQKILSVEIINEQDPITDIALSANTVAENLPVGMTVGNLSTISEDISGSYTYSLVAGDGSEDNAKFAIAGNQLKTNAVFDYETKNAYQIRIKTDNGSGGALEKPLTVFVGNGADAPTDIVLTSSQILENQPVGTVAGTLSVQDQDAGDSHSYSLAAGDGDTQNSLFLIEGNQLITNTVLDYEVLKSCSIRIQAIDTGNATFQKTFTLTVTNANEDPSDIVLSANSVAENQTVNTLVAEIQTTDPDEVENHIYTLVSGDGDADNSLFSINGNGLYTQANFDYETKNSYTIRIQSTDSGGRWVQKSFVITITDANDNPTDVLLSNNIVTENLPAGTVVGTLSFVDPDLGDSPVFTLTADGSGTAFQIDGASLLTREAFDYESQISYSITVMVNDNRGGIYQKTIEVSVANAEEDPTDILLSLSNVTENSPAGTVVGLLTTLDPDLSDSHTYSFVEGAGDSDNASFSINGSNLQTAASFDYELKSSYVIHVQSIDTGGGTTQKSFTILVQNVNDPPTDILLSNNLVTKRSPSGTLVGNLSPVDQDNGDNLLIALVSGDGDADNSLFRIEGFTLVTSDSFSVSEKDTLSIRMRVRDSQSSAFEKVFAISSPNPNTPPTANGDTITTYMDMPITIDVLTNDEDSDGDSLEITEVTTGEETQGTVVIDVDKTTVTYTPNSGITGLCGFSYTISDGRGGSGSADVLVIVEDPASGFPPPVTAKSNKNVYAVVNRPVTLKGTALGGDGSYVVLWSIISQPTGVDNSNTLTTPNALITDFTPSSLGEYVFQFTVNDESQPPVSETIVISVYLPITVDAGADQKSYIGSIFPVQAHIAGGKPQYSALWSVLDGPDKDSSQFDNPGAAQVSFRPNQTGTYLLEIRVTDGFQEPVGDTITVTSIDSGTFIHHWSVY